MPLTMSRQGASPATFDPLHLPNDPYPMYRWLRDEELVYRCEERDCWVFRATKTSSWQRVTCRPRRARSQ